MFSFNEDAYTTNDLSVLSPELIKTPVDLAALAGTSSDDANWVFIVNNDGGMTVLNTLRSQDINGFTSWTTSGHSMRRLHQSSPNPPPSSYSASVESPSSATATDASGSRLRNETRLSKNTKPAGLLAGFLLVSRTTGCC